MAEQEKTTDSQVRLVMRQPARDHEQEALGTQPAGQVQRDPLALAPCREGGAGCAGEQASTLKRATDGQPARARGSLLRLQREYGNRFVRRVVALSRKGQGEGDVAPEVEQAIQTARGGGQALDSTVRAQMEPAMGADFSGVRVHTGGQADTLNRNLSARAFTTGQDIFFKQGEYSPGSSGGRELLAHELTHVVQQNGDSVQTKLTVGAPGDRYEQEADSVARAVLQEEQQANQMKSQDGSVQRQAEEEEKEEEPLQGKQDKAQRQIEEDDDKSISRSVYRSPALQMRSQLRTTALANLSRLVIQRKVDTWGGEWDTDQYDLIKDKDQSGNPTPPALGVRGLDIKLKFTPGNNADAELIGLTQSVQSFVNNAASYTNPTNRSMSITAGDASNINTGAGETDEGTAIDRAAPFNNPIYGVQSSPSASLADPNMASRGQHGYHYRDATNNLRHEKAFLIDKPLRSRAQKDSRHIFETAALAIKGAQAGTYLGSVRWGWRTDGSGTFTKLPVSKVSDGVPSSTFVKSAEIWNASKSSTGANTVDLPIVDVKIATTPITGVYPPGFVGPPLQIPAGTRLQIIRNATPPSTNGQIRVVDGEFTGRTLEVLPADMANIRDERR